MIELAVANFASLPALVSGQDGRVFYGWRIVAALAVTQTVGYGVLFYSFAVILVPMRDELGLSTVTVSGAMTVCLLVCAAASIPAGRWLDRRGGRLLMTTGSIAGTALVLAWSRVHDAVQLYAVFAGIGIVSAMVLYEAAFAVVVTWFHRRRPAALLAITVMGGFASAIFMPLTGFLVGQYGWRTALVILAAAFGILTIPLHLLVRRPADLGLHPDGAAAPPSVPVAHAADRRTILRTAYRDPFFWILTTALVAHSLTASVLGIHLVAYLIDLGHPAGFAAAVTGLLGVLSVTGRLVTTAASRRLSLPTIAALIFTVQGVAAFLLPVTGRSAAGAVACVLGIGLGFGVVSLIKPALVAAQYGIRAFGTISGTMTLPMTLAKAVGPLAAAALLAAAGSYTAVIVVVGAALLLSALAIQAAGRHARYPQR